MSIDYSGLVTQNPEAGERPGKLPQVGLCSRCAHMRQMQSDRGSIFYLCQLSTTDARFPKYPRLPVMRCSGYAASERASNETSH